MNKPLISVIIPIYNNEKYIERCLNSIIENTYQNLEIICVNDGSTDNSLSVINKYTKKFKRFKIVNQENRGVSSARNAGIEIAEGDIVAFVDSDDCVHRQYFELLISCQMQNDYDAVICRSLRTDSYTEDCKIESDSIKVKHVHDIKSLTYDYEVKCRIWGRIYKKSIINNIRFPEGISIGEDTAFNLSVLCSLKECNVAVLNNKLYYYFDRSDSVVHTNAHIHILLLADWYLDNIHNIVNDEGKEVFITETYKAILAGRYLSMFDENRKEIWSKCADSLKACKKLSKEIDGFSICEEIKYRLLANFPILYRLYRIATDRTMLIWEKENRNKSRK